MILVQNYQNQDLGYSNIQLDILTFFLNVFFHLR